MSADTPGVLTEQAREDAVAFVKRLIGAWDCCGTCAGGVLAERDRAVVAAERERADKYRAAWYSAAERARNASERANAAEAKIAAVEKLAASAPFSTPVVSVADLRAAPGGEATS